MKNPCEELIKKKYSCNYKDCEKTMIGFDSRFGYCYCEDHRNVPPAKWEHKDNGQEQT